MSKLIYGCMGLGGAWDHSSITKADIEQANAVIDTALEAGIRRFDHADIYRQGRSEKVFAMVLDDRPGLRDSIELQSKCGIRFADEFGPNRYDLSRHWILKSVEGILQRLNIEQLDTLLLHRPDPLIQPVEIAATFEELVNAGKVKRFGVSNMHHYQIQALQRAIKQPLIANQLEISLKQHAWLDESLYAGNPKAATESYSPGTLEYCMANNIEIQAWGCLARGLYSGAPTQTPNEQATAKLVSQLAEKYSTGPEAILLAWLMRHPAKISPVIGTTNPARIKACAQPLSKELSREDWYALYQSARGAEIP